MFRREGNKLFSESPKFALIAWLVRVMTAVVVMLSAFDVFALEPAKYSFVYPVMSPRRSSGFGMRIHPVRKYSKNHLGVDLAAPIDSPIRAVAGGIVVFADPYAGFGNLVVIKHNAHTTTHYGHCDKLKVHIGQKVSAGEIIATVGSTGLSTGPHLHFELRFDGKAVDPERYFPELATEAQG